MNKPVIIYYLQIILAVATLVAAGFFVNKYLVMRQKEVSNKAVDECAKAALREFKDGNYETREVDRWFYKYCMSDKGYKSVVQ